MASGSVISELVHGLERQSANLADQLGRIYRLGEGLSGWTASAR
jgi:hypothetical protein